MVSELVRKREDGTLYISAIELHNMLGVKGKFANWKDSNVLNKKYKFNEHSDYAINSNVQVTIEGTNIKQIRTDYEMTLRMASHLAMLSKTDKGIEIRDYFIKCEEELHQLQIDNLKAVSMIFTHKDKLQLTNNVLYPILDRLGVLNKSRKRVHQLLKEALVGKYENITLSKEFDTSEFIEDYKILAEKMKEEYSNYFIDKNQVTIFELLEECI